MGTLVSTLGPQGTAPNTLPAPHTLLGLLTCPPLQDVGDMAPLGSAWGPEPRYSELMCAGCS